MNELAFNRAAAGDGRDPLNAVDPSAPDAARRHDVPFVVRYLRIAKRWKWLLIGSIGVAAILGLILTVLMTPKYTATTTIEIQRENYRIVQVQGVEPEASSVDNEFYQTQYGLLKSRSLSERVARELRLFDDLAFFEMFGASEAASQLREGGAAASSPSARAARTRTAGTILRNNVSISPMRMSRLVVVEFTSPDPQLSARVLNAWTNNFIRSSLERKFEATSYARRFLEERLGQLRQRLEESERLLVGYASQEGIINLPSNAEGGGTTERPIIAEDLAELNRRLNQATAERIAAESRLSTAGGSTPEALQNQAISGLRERRAQLAADYARILTQFEPEYPAAQAIASQLQQIDAALATEEARVRGTLRANYEAAEERETSLRNRVASLRGDLLDLRRRSIQYNIFQRDVDTNRQLYDGLLQRYKEIGVAGGVGVNNIAIVDAAAVPLRPSSPRLLLNMFAALLLGTMLGVGLALALEQIDEAISDPTDVEEALDLPLLGTIPKVGGDNTEAEMEDPKSPLVEAYLSAQTSLGFTTDHGVPRTLTVTSTRPAEGKTTTSYAIARSLVRTGRRVVLVDADMRSPTLHHIFEASNSKGLSNYLAGEGNALDLVQRGFSNGIDLVPAGPPPPNAAELLTGPRLDKLLQDLADAFDHVILDVPPIMGLADTPLIASRVEGVVFVIQSHATKASLARVAIGRLRDARAKVVGVLLTKFESRRAHFGYGYDYGYGYGTVSKNEA